MGCIVEFNKDVRFNFARNKSKQKIWIEALFCFTHIDIHQLAMLLEVSVEKLIMVRMGAIYFSQEVAEELGKLLLVALSD